MRVIALALQHRVRPLHKADTDAGRLAVPLAVRSWASRAVRAVAPQNKRLRVPFSRSDTSVTVSICAGQSRAHEARRTVALSHEPWVPDGARVMYDTRCGSRTARVGHYAGTARTHREVPPVAVAPVWRFDNLWIILDHFGTAVSTVRGGAVTLRQTVVFDSSRGSPTRSPAVPSA